MKISPRALNETVVIGNNRFAAPVIQFSKGIEISVVYSQTSVTPNAPDRSSLKTSKSSSGEMRPATGDPSDKVVAVLRKLPWSSTDCAPTPSALRTRHKETTTAKRSILPTDGNKDARRAEFKRMSVSLQNQRRSRVDDTQLCRRKPSLRLHLSPPVGAGDYNTFLSSQRICQLQRPKAGFGLHEEAVLRNANSDVLSVEMFLREKKTSILARSHSGSSNSITPPGSIINSPPDSERNTGRAS